MICWCVQPKSLKNESKCVQGVDIGVENAFRWVTLRWRFVDAATVLVPLDRLWGLGFDLERLAELGLRLRRTCGCLSSQPQRLGRGAWAVTHRHGPAAGLVCAGQLGVHAATAGLFKAPDLTRNAARENGRGFLSCNRARQCDVQAGAAPPQTRRGGRVRSAGGNRHAATDRSGSRFFVEFATRGSAGARAQRKPAVDAMQVGAPAGVGRHCWTRWKRRVRRRRRFKGHQVLMKSEGSSADGSRMAWDRPTFTAIPGTVSGATNRAVMVGSSGSQRTSSRDGLQDERKPAGVFGQVVQGPGQAVCRELGIRRAGVVPFADSRPEARWRIGVHHGTIVRLLIFRDPADPRRPPTTGRAWSCPGAGGRRRSGPRRQRPPPVFVIPATSAAPPDGSPPAPTRSRASSTSRSTTSTPRRCCSPTSGAHGTDNLIVVSPDVGGVVRARAIAKRLDDADLAIIDKRRPRPTSPR